MTGRRRREPDARLRLSALVEPGDPRLPLMLQEHGAAEVLAAVREGRPIDGRSLPRVWLERMSSLERTCEAATARARATGLRWIVPGDAEWPDRLNDLDLALPHAGSTGAPLGLWVRGGGDLRELTGESVSIVGARSCTTYGKERAGEMAADVADQRCAVVSGAAFGIDVAAHRGALIAGGRTVAVLACGADVDYPRGHAGLLSRIAEEGAVVSEQLPGETPMRSRFLTRNRVIAAISGGTVVVEAARRSGSLNTLHWADALGRVTMAVPGAVTSVQSLGTHQAVRDGLAQLVTDGRDVLAALGGVARIGETQRDADHTDAATTESGRDPLASAVARVLDALSFEAPRTSQQIAQQARVQLADVESVLERFLTHGWCARAHGRWVLRRPPRPGEASIG